MAKRFTFVNGLRRSIDARRAEISSVRFDICYNHVVVINFDALVTEARAIQEVEEWLSQPITRDWWMEFVVAGNYTNASGPLGEPWQGDIRGEPYLMNNYLEGAEFHEGSLRLKAVSN